MTMKRSAWIIVGILMTLVLSINVAFAQEEVEAVEASGNNSIGLVIAVLGIGVLVVLGLGAAMNAQANEEKSATE